MHTNCYNGNCYGKGPQIEWLAVRQVEQPIYSNDWQLGILEVLSSELTKSLSYGRSDSIMGGPSEALVPMSNLTQISKLSHPGTDKAVVYMNQTQSLAGPIIHTTKCPF